jgi:hypothetical protein
MKKPNGYDNTTNEFGTKLSIEERKGGSIALILNGGVFEDAEVLITPEQSRDLGEMLMRCGIHALTGVEVEPGQTISDQIRAKLGVRVQLVAKNLTDRGKSPEFIAQEVVDIVCRELL